MNYAKIPGEVSRLCAYLQNKSAELFAAKDTCADKRPRRRDMRPGV